MFPEGDVWSTLMFLLLLTTGAPAEKICSVHSNHEVHMGSSFQIYCIFKKECKRLIYRDEFPSNYSSLNSTVVIMSIVKLTRTTTFTCKCQNEPEPCGTDIVPGYPPAVPRNLTCVQEGELGPVNCAWRTGRETLIKTTSHLWVQEGVPVGYESSPVHDETSSASFPVSSTQSSFSVWIRASNSLGTANSTVLNFTLDEIVKPLSPKITTVKCSSRQCQLYPDNTQNIQLVEIRYRKHRTSWNTISVNNTNSTTSWTISSLNPYHMYTFKVRCKFSRAKGLWSDWTQIKGMTDEEAPVSMLDAWYIEDSTPTAGKSFQLFWRELKESEARGKILQYIVTLPENGISRNTTPSGNTTRVSCFSCTVSISARNSKGLSPARLIQLRPKALLSYKVSHTLLNNHSVALSWSRPVDADSVTDLLVEWFPVGQKQQLEWIRVDRQLNAAHITGLQPAQCYEGAVVYLQSSWTQKAVFNRIATWQTAPQLSPVTSIDVKRGSVAVKWSEIPAEKRGGCVQHYTIYLKDSRGKIQNYSVPYPQRGFTITGLILGQKYRLWVSAWTTAGESPIENEHVFKLKQIHETLDEKPLALLISLGSVVLITCLCLLCLCQFSSVHRRLSGCCHCLMPSIVPDPANSKWAKECSREKGEMKIQLHLSDSSMNEEEPNTVEVEEFSQEKLPEDETIPAEETLHPADMRAESAPRQQKVISSYLKSFSNESSSSDNTQASRGTDITVDYISTHGVISGDEEEEDDQDHKVFDFFPCHRSRFLEPLITNGGTLTLASVKIDCSDFLDCA